MKNSNSMTVSEAAKLMGVTEQFIRIGLQNKELPFGYAVKMSKSKYTYYISAPKFEEFTGICIGGNPLDKD